MNALFKVFIFLSIITFTLLKNEIYSQFLIRGNVFYSDNYSAVADDKIYILIYDYESCSVRYIDSSNTDSYGNYELYTFYHDSVLVCSAEKKIQNEDHVTTYYPSTIDWTQAQPIYPPDNPTNVNIAVQRIISADTANSISGTITTLDSNNNPIPLIDAFVVAQQDTSFISFSTTDLNGYYILDSLYTGSAIIYATKIGYSLDSTTIIVGGNALNHPNLNLKKAKSKNSLYLQGRITKNAFSYKLEQNYPNPFNPTTKIRFIIPNYIKNEVSVRLTIYDILGRVVCKLMDATLKAGTYELIWDATKYSSGIYFYELKSNWFSDVKRMLLVK